MYGIKLRVLKVTIRNFEDSTFLRQFTYYELKAMRQWERQTHYGTKGRSKWLSCHTLMKLFFSGVDPE